MVSWVIVLYTCGCGKSYCFRKVFIKQILMNGTSNQKVMGSTPDRSTRIFFFRECLCHSLKKNHSHKYSCWCTGKIRFSPLGVKFHFYANYVNKFSFVLYTNMAVMQTIYYSARFYCGRNYASIMWTTLPRPRQLDLQCRSFISTLIN